MDQELADVLMLFINTTVNPGAALGYAQTRSGGNKYVSDSPELIYFVKNYIPAGAGIRSSVSYTIDGKDEEKTLTNYDFASFILSREMFDGFNLTNTGGNTGVQIDYIGSAQNLDDEYKNIQIIRTINGDLTVGNTVEIVYDVTLPAGMTIGGLTITDRLPSNMRYQSVSSGNSWQRRFSVSNREKQFVDISVWREQNSPRNMKVSYHAIITGAGEYIFEPAYARVKWGDENARNMWGSTERITVECK